MLRFTRVRRALRQAYPRFWLKSILYRTTPGRFGYYRRLARCETRDYVHERDKHPLRRKHFGSEGWSPGNGAIVYRSYEDYQEYALHQSLKLEEMLKFNGGGFTNTYVWNERLRFFSRFRRLRDRLPPAATIVCLGARQGTEVEVLRDLGFADAYGIDLNPGPQNPYVRRGDFMHLAEAPASVDLIYCNAVDHAFELRAFFAEHARVLKRDGYALYELPVNCSGAGAFEAVRWASDRAVIAEMLEHFETIVALDSDHAWKWILLQGKRAVPSRDAT